MPMLRPVALLVIVFFFGFTSFAQNDDEAAKERRRQKNVLIEQVLAEAQSLKLPENRAFVYAQIGNLIRQTDEKRARELFQAAVAELIEAQTLAETDKKNAPHLQDLLTSQSLRPRILKSIAYLDAELALESLYKTRPAKITRALANFSPNSDRKQAATNASQNDSHLAQNEINLEQHLMSIAADQNPERAVALLEKSLEKGITGATLNLLQKLHSKNPARAKQILFEVGEKLTKYNYDADEQDFNNSYQKFLVAVNFLNEFIRERSADENSLQFDNAQFRNLANKMISSAMKTEIPNFAYSISNLIPIAKKLFPDSAEPLRQKQVSLSRYQRHGGFGIDLEARELMQGDAAPEKLLSEAGKFPLHVRRQIYRHAANKYADQGNFGAAERILRSNFSEEELEQALADINWQMANKAISQGNFNEAINLIYQLPENRRLQALLFLAENAYRQNPEENKALVLSILEQARSQISEKPEDTNEMTSLLQIIDKYAEFEPGEAFRLLDSLIPQINELSEAAILVSGFNGNFSKVRKGEVVIFSGHPSGIHLGDIHSPLRSLLKSDFNRTTQLINKFQRPETRINMKLSFAETLN